ncbi:MAG: ORF6N domain-containing protein [Deltaproteobacteria bacterium]|nr:ORF6N domain-containing protein [Deltaproteobacteria bacterium]MBN2672838.1 ORF6N domain-containing protein [Deltaproteobacteria bacterium]
MPNDSSLVPIDAIGKLIRMIRGKKGILDEDIAALYGIETRALNRAVRRHRERFPEDFMIELTLEEYRILISQNGTSESDVFTIGGRRKPPFVFTEQGVAMLSSVLNSPRAIEVNIAIMRTFVRLREILASNRNIERQLKSLDKKVANHDKLFRSIFDTIAQLMAADEKSTNRRIGFEQDS